MYIRARHYRYLIAATAGLFLAVAAWGQTAPLPPPAQPDDAVFAEIIRSRLTQIEESHDLDQASKDAARKLYQEAQKELEKLKEPAARAARHAMAAAAAPRDIERAKANLAAPPTAPDVAIPQDFSVQEIEQKISQDTAELGDKRADLTRLEATIKGWTKRRPEIPQEIAKARDALTALDQQLQAPPAAGESSVASAARRFVLLARRRTIEQNVLCFEKEIAEYEATVELLPLQRDMAAREIALQEQKLKMWQEAVNRRRQQEAERQVQQASREVGHAHPAIRQLAERNAALAATRKELAERIVKTTQQLEKTQEKLAALKDRFKRAREKVEAVGLTNAIGLLLRKQREALPNLRVHRRNIGDRQTDIREGQLALLQLGDRRAELANFEAYVQSVLHDLERSEGKTRREQLEPAVREALQTEKEYLDAVIADHNMYFDKLVDLDNVERQLIDESEQCARYVDERVLWIASGSPFDASDVRYAGEALWWIAGPAAWGEVGRTLLSDAARNPALPALAAFVFGLLLYWRHRFLLRVQQIGEQAARGSFHSFLPTVEALLLTGLIAAVWPGLMAYVGWRLSAAASGSEWCKAVGNGLTATARIYFVLELLRKMCRHHGLAEAHFGWSAVSVKHLRQYVRWLGVPMLPLVMIAVTMSCQENERWDGSLGRMSFVALMLVVSLMMQRVLRPSGGVFQAVLAEHRGDWLDRLRYVWYPLGVLIPLSLGGLAAAGYYYTAQQLSARLVVTAYLLLGLILLRALLLRWILVSQRKLAFEEARKRRAAALVERREGEEPADSCEPPTPVAPERDLAAINAQTRRLIQYALAVAGLFALWFVWIDVAPALRIFNRIELLEDIALTDVIIAAVALAMTAIAAKNIPGLLEMAVLQHLPLDAGARYALATVSRYATTIVGVTVACHFVGLGWSKVQWLLAAVSVGLGFGLQEIFANFVSGLIILLERPIRVGDVVTIDTVTGKVSKIRMRATTIIDWDRRELLIPNKEFITGRVLNWTLSDQVNRIVVNVGIAYGSDTERAAELLMKVAKDHPVVLDDPPPKVALEGFGDSALNFVLRCFLPNLDNRPNVIHDLHMAIDRQFRAAGIEIAFPQQDVHVRSIDAALSFLHPPVSAAASSVAAPTVRPPRVVHDGLSPHSAANKVA